jgi:predicted ATPase/DNA-binding XRE family transcriptional regulator
VVATLGGLLRAHRMRRGLSQEALAGLVEPRLSVNTIGNLERGRTHPYGHTVTALADALQLGAEERTELLGAWSAAGGVASEAGPPEPATSVTADTLRARPNNLPAPLTSFVGREADLARIAELLAKARLLTLTGPGGAGKTRLAIEVARVLDAYPDGVWLVELAPLAQPELVCQTVAVALGATEERGQPILTTLTSAIAGRRVLLVLDNCEHLVAACADLAEALLRACPNLTVLATSREPLDVAGETIWPVPPLGIEDPRDAPLAALARADAVRLFVDRARAVRPDFTLTVETAPMIARICRRLDGLPLAIELAAARVNVLAPKQIAARLDDRFRLLTGGHRAAPRHHQTLRGLFDWSYDLLSPSERALFRRLSVFSGGWTIEAAEAVCAGSGVDPSDVLDVLASLVTKSLVLAQEEPDGAVRYRLLETLREYGAERLDRSERAAVEETHSRYFTALVEDGFDRLWSADTVAWCDWLESEHDNLRAVLTRGRALAESGAPAEGQALLAARTAAGLMWFWYFRNYWHEGRSWLGSLARLTDLPPNLHGRLLGWHSSLAFYQGETGTAESLGRRALTIAERSGERALAAVITAIQAVHAAWSGKLDEAGELAGRALAAITALNPAAFETAHLPTRDWMIGFVQYARAQRALFVGDVDEADEATRLALETMRLLGQPFGTTAALSLRGSLLTRRGDLRGARVRLEEALELAHHAAPGQVQADILGRLAKVAQLGGDDAEARRLFARSLALRRELGHKLGVAQDLVGLAAVELASRSQVAATLLAASDALLATIDVRRRSADHDEFVRWRERARCALGDDELAAAWDRGAGMPYDDVVRYAIAVATDG